MRVKSSQNSSSQARRAPRPSKERKREVSTLNAGISLRKRDKKAFTAPIKRPVNYQVVFQPENLPLKLAYVVIGLLAAHLLLAFLHYEVQRLPWLLRQMFDVDEENNLPTWYSGMSLFITSVFLWLCAREKGAAGDQWLRQWKILALGFFLLSVDEIAGLHETFNSVFRISWAIPGGIFAMVIGFVLMPFLLSLERKTAKRFALAGVIYFGGAVGVELLAEPFRLDSLAYYMMTFLEEGMEMTGVLIFMHALLMYMSGQHNNQIKIDTNVAASDPQSSVASPDVQSSVASPDVQSSVASPDAQ